MLPLISTQNPPQKVTLVGLDHDISTRAMNFGKVLFLDIDGVLHPETCSPESNFCCLPNFCNVLRHVDPEQRVPVVISSMWRQYNTLSSMREAFPSVIAAQIVGVTPYLTIEQLRSVVDWGPLGGEQSKDRHRQREITMWMHAYAPEGQWLAIDDHPEYFFDNCLNLFTVPRSSRPGLGGITSDVAHDLMLRIKRFLNEY